MKLTHTIPTPCVGICSTAVGDHVCRGCKRYAHEVIDWNSFSYEQKAAIEARLTSLLTTIIQSKWLIIDEAKLQFQLDNQPTANLPKHRNLYCQSFVLIKTGASSIQSIDSFGLRILPEWQNTPLRELCRIIDEDFWALSIAHYDRYYNILAKDLGKV